MNNIVKVVFENTSGHTFLCKDASARLLYDTFDIRKLAEQKDHARKLSEELANWLQVPFEAIN